MEDDIEELKSIVSIQREYIKTLKNMIDILPSSVYLKDTKGRYLGKNAYAIQKMESYHLDKITNPCLNNITPSSVIGKTDYDFFDKEYADQYRQHDQEVLETGKEIVFEETITLPNGDTLTNLSFKKPLRNTRGDITGIVGNSIDITHLKRIENELRLSKKECEQANMLKKQFIKNMEHDIRTPISGIYGLAQLLLDEESNPNKKENLRMMCECSKELLDYLNNILDFSKIERGDNPVLEEQFYFTEIIEKVRRIQMCAAKDKNLEFRVLYDPEIPKILIGDKYRLLTILLNLLGNAIKFTHEGYVALKIVFAGLDRERNRVIVHFEIEDTGIGMSPDHQEFMYEKFTKEMLSNTGLYKGLGFGLPIVKQFIDEMNAEINVISDKGIGTKFSFNIPFKLPLAEIL